jgi:hypothetical protein
MGNGGSEGGVKARERASCSAATTASCSPSSAPSPSSPAAPSTTNADGSSGLSGAAVLGGGGEGEGGKKTSRIVGGGGEGEGGCSNALDGMLSATHVPTGSGGSRPREKKPMRMPVTKMQQRPALNVLAVLLET